MEANETGVHNEEDDIKEQQRTKKRCKEEKGKKGEEGSLEPQVWNKSTNTYI